MKKKLLILNVALAAAVIWTGLRVRSDWQARRAREAAILNHKLNTPAAPPYAPLPQLSPAAPAAYADIAQKTLFDRSRDSTVVVESAPVAPPKPMPALPVYHGQMNLGNGAMIILSESSTAQHRGLRVGQQIGEFKLVDATPTELAFEWEGKVVRKNVEELLDRSGATPAQAAAPRMDRPAAVAAPAPVQQTKKVDPSQTCNPNDGNADGAVVDGYRKVTTHSPFGDMCYWEAVRR